MCIKIMSITDFVLCTMQASYFGDACCILQNMELEYGSTKCYAGPYHVAKQTFKVIMTVGFYEFCIPQITKLVADDLSDITPSYHEIDKSHVAVNRLKAIGFDYENDPFKTEVVYLLTMETRSLHRPHRSGLKLVKKVKPFTFH